MSLGEISAKDLAEQADEWINKWLGLKDRFDVTLDEIVKIIERKRSVAIEETVTIEIMPSDEIPPHLGAAQTYFDKNSRTYLLDYDKNYDGALLLTVIIHELVHIMMGDADNRVCRRYLEGGETEPTEPNNLIEFVVDEQNEKIIEYVAECLVERIGSNERRVGREIGKFDAYFRG